MKSAAQAKHSLQLHLIGRSTHLADKAQIDKLGFGEVTKMNRVQLATYITEIYNAASDYPWARYPNYEVFRHANNKKWFAVIMDVPKEKLGLQGKETLDVVNFKCAPIMIGSLRMEKGFFSAYHMSKESWITVALDGSVPDDKIKMLLDISYDATVPKIKKRKG